MKKLLLIIILILSTSLLFSQEKLNLPGDNLNLYSVLDLFQKCKTLQEFEKKLNDEDSRINNMDLNEDGKIDYIQVVDNTQGSSHAIALRVAISENETQDIAIIEVEKNGDNVSIQIIGDEALYGKDYIIEPPYTEISNPGYSGDNSVTVSTTYTNIANWAIVSYMYNPYYSVYSSPYYWGYYPGYWNPWHPYYYDIYYSYHHSNPYYNYYRRGYYYRSPGIHSYYAPRRVYSPTINNRYPRNYQPNYGHPQHPNNPNYYRPQQNYNHTSPQRTQPQQQNYNRQPQPQQQQNSQHAQPQQNYNRPQHTQPQHTQPGRR